MQYNKMDTSLVDTTMFIDDDEQYNKIPKKNSLRIYRLVTLISLILFLVCLIILLTTIFHKKRYSYANNPSVLTQGSTCNKSLLAGGCEYFTRVDSWDYPENDMLETVVIDYETCCSMCWHQTSCMGFSYSPSEETCWIKTKMTENTGHFHSDRISGYLSACTNEKRMNNWNYLNNNLFEGEMNGSIPAIDWKTCCSLCLHETSCKAYTFSISTQQCWLKDKVGNGTFDSNKISGNRD